jgi:hypothetical protein
MPPIGHFAQETEDRWFVASAERALAEAGWLIDRSARKHINHVTPVIVILASFCHRETRDPVGNKSESDDASISSGKQGCSGSYCGVDIGRSLYILVCTKWHITAQRL